MGRGENSLADVFAFVLKPTKKAEAHMSRCFENRGTGRQQAQTDEEECVQMECGDCEIHSPHKPLSLHTTPSFTGNFSEDWGYKAPTDTSAPYVDLFLFFVFSPISLEKPSSVAM